MDILVLYTMRRRNERKTIDESLFCFGRYAREHRFFYLNVTRPTPLPQWIARYPFDGVIVHYTYLANRLSAERWEAYGCGVLPGMEKLSGYKVMIPQDEYTLTKRLRQFAKAFGVDCILTCAAECDYDTLYPRQETGDVRISTVFTGYVDDRARKGIERLAKKVRVRPIDIGYRARRLPYYFGRHGQLKADLADCVNARLKDYPQIRADVSTTEVRNNANVLFGEKWTEFLLSCRTVLGSLGGSFLMDEDGDVMRRSDAYVRAHPDAAFEEVEAACFPGLDGQLHLSALSPRHFECAMTKTCQVLVEGEYFGVFLPGVHYIEIKRDFSNIDEVLEKVQDHALCEEIARRCYNDIAAKAELENPYTYASFAARVADIIQEGWRGRPAAASAPGRAAFGLRLKCLVLRRRAAEAARNVAQKGYHAFCVFFARHPRILRLGSSLLGRGKHIS